MASEKKVLHDIRTAIKERECAQKLTSIRTERRKVKQLQKDLRRQLTMDRSGSTPEEIVSAARCVVRCAVQSSVCLRIQSSWSGVCLESSRVYDVRPCRCL
jgi:hypothetical protein